MLASQRIVTQLPLTELWDDTGNVQATQEHFLEREQVRQLLQAGPVRFLVADVGHPLHWVPESEAYAFWKLEARSHIVESPDLPFDIYSFPEGYAYIASRWHRGDTGAAVMVLLEKHH